jgi:phage protein D
VRGQDNPSASAGLLNLLIVETVEGLYHCEMTLGNWGVENSETGFLYLDRQKIDFGDAIEISYGAGDSPERLFLGRVMGIEGDYPEGAAPRITFLAEDHLQDLRMTRRTRSFIDSTDAAVFQQIASDHSLQAQVDLNGPTHKILAQVNQSDLAFLRQRARALGAEIWLDDTTLHASPRANRASASASLTYNANLLSFVVLADLANQRTAVTASGWDVSGKQSATHEADEAVISGEVNGQTSGPGLLSEKLGERKEFLAHTLPFSGDEATSHAEAYFKMMARRFVVGRAIAQPPPIVHVGSTVTLASLGGLFSGDYYVSEVRHTFTLTQGFRSEFRVERPFISSAE